ncbi:MAG: hypothetical protein CGW95_12255 [Phenylobacterium zucineum]|nr:MAG: hypothetical protein CGW95_12255 [Phenylobacterium zucineum]
MAKLYVTEFQQQGADLQGVAIPIGKQPASIDQTPVVIGAGSLQSAAFSAQTCLVRIHTDAICSIAFGTNPTASANTMRMGANTTEYFSVLPGSAMKVAVITNT